MLSKPRFVLFLSLLCLVRYSISSEKRLKWIFSSATYIVRCAEDQYLIVTDWWELAPADISCLNEVNPYLDQQTSPAKDDSVIVNCNSRQDKFDVTYCLADPSADYNEIKENTGVSGSMIFHGKNDFPLTSRWKLEIGSLCFEQSGHPWSGKPVFISYIKFDNSSIICRNTLYFSGMVANGTCTGEREKKQFLCYYDLLSNSAPKVADWDFLERFVGNNSLIGNGWQKQGGYHINMKMFQTATATVK